MDPIAEFNQMMLERGHDLKAVLIAYQKRGRSIYEIRSMMFTTLFHTFHDLGTYTVGNCRVKVLMDTSTHDLYFEETEKLKTL